MKKGIFATTILVIALAFALGGRAIGFLGIDLDDIFDSPIECLRKYAEALNVAVQNERISVSLRGGDANGHSFSPHVSPSGRFVAFVSQANNLVEGDQNGVEDIFVYDRSTRGIKRFSVAADGREASGPSGHPHIGDGGYLFFDSEAPDLVAGDTNHRKDVFRVDMESGRVTRLSERTDGVEGNGTSESPFASRDEKMVAFTSFASNLVEADLNGTCDVLVYDASLASIERVSVSSEEREGNGCSAKASLSADGRYVVFQSEATNLVENDTNGVMDIFLHDRWKKWTERLSVSRGGGEANGPSLNPVISPDARFVTFASRATNLVERDENGQIDIFLLDRQSGEIQIASRGRGGADADGRSQHPALSALRGGFVFQSTASNLATDLKARIEEEIPEDFPIDPFQFIDFDFERLTRDENNLSDIFLFVPEPADILLRASVTSDFGDANGASLSPSVSDNGRLLAFVSAGSNLIPDDRRGFQDIFLVRVEIPPFNCPLMFERERERGVRRPSGDGPSFPGEGERVPRREVQESGGCLENDDGKNPFRSGMTTVETADGIHLTEFDYCCGKQYLKEYFCAEGRAASQWYYCHVCRNGACARLGWPQEQANPIGENLLPAACH